MQTRKNKPKQSHPINMNSFPTVVDSSRQQQQQQQQPQQCNVISQPISLLSSSSSVLSTVPSTISIPVMVMMMNPNTR